jgi:cobaltochelatase CobS
MTNIDTYKADKTTTARELFNIDSDIEVPIFAETNEYVPDIDPSYYFDKDITLAIIAGFKHNKNVLIQGFHGTGKSSHIEQVAARINWPCIRVSLDSFISRNDLIGRDAIVLKDGLQVTEFKEGILPWAIKQRMALIFDEYDAARPDTLFTLQRILENNGKLTLVEQNQVIEPHPAFRMFATSNTIGLGDTTGIYHGTHQINQGQMDRWNIVATLNYLDHDSELKIILSKLPSYNNDQGIKLLQAMIALAGLVRNGFAVSDISVLMSPRTIISWAENYEIFQDLELAFKYSFLNKSDDTEKEIIAEYYQRCFATELKLT